MAGFIYFLKTCFCLSVINKIFHPWPVKKDANKTSQVLGVRCVVGFFFFFFAFVLANTQPTRNPEFQRIKN